MTASRFLRLILVAVVGVMLASSATAIRAPEGARAPLPDYDVRTGFIGNPDDLRASEAVDRIRAERREFLKAQPRLRVSGFDRTAAEGIVAERFGERAVARFSATGVRSLFLPGGALSSARGDMDAAQAARGFLGQNGDLFGLSADQIAGLKAHPTLTAPGGTSHIVFEQTLNGRPIDGAMVKVSLRADNAVLMVAGSFMPELKLAGGENLSATDAALRSLNYIGKWDSDGLAKPYPAGAWSPGGLRTTDWSSATMVRMADAGPQVVRDEGTADRRVWVNQGPYMKEILARQIVYPLHQQRGRLAWRLSLWKAPMEWYVMDLDAETGLLLSRRNSVQFSAKASVFATHPDDGPQVTGSFEGDPTASPLTFHTPSESGLTGNNVIMITGANEQAGAIEHWLRPYTASYETSGGLFELNDIGSAGGGRSLVFKPRSPDGYFMKVQPAMSTPSGGNLGLGDDDFACGPPPVDPWPFFGTDYSTICVGSNGFVTMGAGDTDFTEDLIDDAFFDVTGGRIMGIWDDLDPSSGGAVEVSFVPGSRLCFRWDDVPQFGTADANDFGVCLFANGKFRMDYPDGGSAILDGAVGASTPGNTISWHPFDHNARLRGMSGLARQFPDVGDDMQTGATNVFWLLNEGGHDRQYFNGLTETGGAMQQHDFVAGGGAGDPIWGFTDVESTNNAFFGTPPDGACCPFTGYLPFTDPPFRNVLPNFDADVVIHEHGHGLSNRAVGGGSLSVGGFHSGAMGEGWSDAMALFYDPSDNVVGEFATGDSDIGIRFVAYGPHSPRELGQFGNIFGPFLFSQGLGYLPQVHSDGEIWPTTLMELRRTLEAAGWSNEEVEHLVVSGMYFTPPFPNMLDGRDAILAADGGANECDIWHAFAHRGMGHAAAANNPSLLGFATNDVGMFAAYNTPGPCGGFFNLDSTVVPMATFEAAGVGATSADGWTGQGLWHVSDDRAAGGSQSMYFGIENAGTYDTAATEWGNLTAGPFDLSGTQHPVLEFDVFMDVENDATFDTLRVRVPQTSANPRAAIRQQQNLPFFTDGAFTRYRVDLTEFAGTTNKTIQLYFDTLDSSFNAFEGVYVDNITINDYHQE